jgi:hypothetical protein
MNPTSDGLGQTQANSHPWRVRQRHPPERNSPLTVAPASYEIRIKGELRQPVLAFFADFAAATRAPETVLSGALPDQHALHRVLQRIQSLGLELIAVRRVSAPTESRIRRFPVEAGRDSPPSPDDGVTLRLAVRR